jgi:hypothetical protein
VVLKLKPLLAVATAAAALAIVVAAASGSGKKTDATWPPQKYRYTGWLGVNGEMPVRAVSEGDSFAFYFDDRGSLGSTRYRVCWRHLETGKRQCAARIERYPHLGRVRIAGPHLRFGRYVARWYVYGQIVASWPFLYSPERTR